MRTAGSYSLIRTPWLWSSPAQARGSESSLTSRTFPAEEVGAMSRAEGRAGTQQPQHLRESPFCWHGDTSWPWPMPPTHKKAKSGSTNSKNCTKPSMQVLHSGGFSGCLNSSGITKHWLCILDPLSESVNTLTVFLQGQSCLCSNRSLV